MIYFVSHGELGLRSSAVILLEQFLAKYNYDVKDYSEQMKCDQDEESKQVQDNSKLHDICERSNFITFHLLPAIRTSINLLKDELQLKSCLRVFRKYLVCVSELHKDPATQGSIKECSVPSEYIDMACVINDHDDNIDFFENILNIKLQRRYKAIRQLVTKIDEKEISSTQTLTKIVLPIADMFIIRMSQIQSTQRGVLTYTKQNLEQINNECYLLYTKVCSVLPWGAYQNLIKKSIIKVTGVNLRSRQRLSATAEKNMTKVICAIISGFSFDVPDVVEELEKTLSSKKKSTDLQSIIDRVLFKRIQKQKDAKDDGLYHEKEKKDEEEPDIHEIIQEFEHEDVEVEKEPENIEQHRESIRTRINKSFLPILFKHLKEPIKKGETPDDAKIRIHVAVAITKLLKRTTNQQFTEGFGKLVRNIVN